MKQLIDKKRIRVLIVLQGILGGFVSNAHWFGILPPVFPTSLKTHMQAVALLALLLVLELAGTHVFRSIGPALKRNLIYSYQRKAIALNLVVLAYLLGSWSKVLDLCERWLGASDATSILVYQCWAHIAVGVFLVITSEYNRDHDPGTFKRSNRIPPTPPGSARRCK